MRPLQKLADAPPKKRRAGGTGPVTILPNSIPKVILRLDLGLAGKISNSYVFPRGMFCVLN